MSKIGNLFKKILKKKKNSQDLDEIFSDKFEDGPIQEGEDLDEEEIADFDDSDFPREDIVLSEDSLDVTGVDHSLSDDGDTREIDISALQLESSPGEANQLAQAEDDDILEEFDDGDFEDDAQEADEEDEEDYYEEESDFDYTMDTGSHLQHEIDLDNDKITLKDRLDHMWTRFIDRFRNMNKKDLNQAMKPPGKEKTFTKIKVPASIDKAVGKVKKVEWNSLIDRLLKPKERPGIHRNFQYAFTFILVIILANTIGGIIFSSKPDHTAGIQAPVVINEDKMITQAQLNSLRSSKLFKTTQPEIAKQPDKKQVDIFTKCAKATQKSSLPIKLFHTVVLQDSVKSIASVSVRSGSKVETFREGDKISSLANLDRIERLKLIVKNLSSGDCEYIPSTLDKAVKNRPSNIGVLTPRASKQYKKELKKIDGIENDGSNFKIKKAFLKEKMKDLSSIITQAKGIPITNPDGTMSFKIVQIEPDSIYSYLGIENGDIITAINGEPIENLNAVTSLFAKISNIEKLNLTITRSGEAVTQNYNIK